VPAVAEEVKPEHPDELDKEMKEGRVDAVGSTRELIVCPEEVFFNCVVRRLVLPV
jgi:hypothetical protein